jgi:hypothetical protein
LAAAERCELVILCGLFLTLSAEMNTCASHQQRLLAVDSMIEPGNIHLAEVNTISLSMAKVSTGQVACDLLPVRGICSGSPTMTQRQIHLLSLAAILYPDPEQLASPAKHGQATA